MRRFATGWVAALLIFTWMPAAPAQQPVTLAFSTLDTGSAWYVYGATIAELLRKSLPVGSNVDVKPRAGGVGNPRLVAKNETPLGFSFTVTNRWAWVDSAVSILLPVRPARLIPPTSGRSHVRRRPDPDSDARSPG